MKILYAVHGYKPAYRIGGPIVSVAAVAERLVSRGHEVIVFTTNSNLDSDLEVPTDKPIDVSGVQVWYFRHEEPIKKWLRSMPYFAKSLGFLYAPAMRSQLDRIVPSVDVVHTQLPFIYPTYAAAKAAIHSQKPLYYQQRGVFDPERLKFRALKKKIYISIIERPIMREATTLIALTQTEVQTYRALGVWTPCRIVPNGVDIIEDTCGLEHLAATFTFSLDDIVILFMARLHPIKGADRLIRAFLSINREFPRAKLILAGPDEWGIASQFRQEIAEAGALDKVIFAGMADGQIKQGILERADLFCLPSDAEGFSMGVLEALASSTAVLISPGCHFPEVEAFGAGRIVRPEPDLLASAIAELIGNREQLREMGRKGRILVEQRYSWDGITDLLEEVYFEGIDRHQSITAQQPTRRRVIKHLP